jgi:PIN domain nuclease of toxin-antitoxin system
MLLDTHVLVWAMLAPKLLSGPAREALSTSTERCVSAASLYEIAYQVMRGKWPEVEGLLSMDLDARLRSDGFQVIPASGPVMERAGRLDWAHRDPFDRIIVATALERALRVVSKDGTLDGAPGEGLRRVW